MASTPTDDSDVMFMCKALDVAEAALQVGEVPVGCVLVMPTARGDVIVSHGANQVNATRDATRHAEIVAIDRMLSHGVSSDQLRLPPDIFHRHLRKNSSSDDTEKLQEYFDDRWVNDLKDSDSWENQHGWGSGRKYTLEELKFCRLYVTCEPCIMCAAALAQVGISKVYFGCSNTKFGGCGSILSLHDKPVSYHTPYSIVKGVLEPEAISLLRSFYNRENFHAPEDKRKRKDEKQQNWVGEC